MKRCRVLPVFTIVLGLALAACQKAETPAAPPSAATEAPAPPPPPLAPDTILGKLVKVERTDHTLVHVLSLTRTGVSGWSDKDQKAGKGKTFLVLHFEGKPAKPLPEMELPTMFPIDFRQTSSAVIMAMVYDAPWLTDLAGKKYKNGLPVMKKDTRQIAYEIPADAQGLVWHAAKQEFQLEPYPGVIAPTATAAPPK
jgi:hypothetical protein